MGKAIIILKEMLKQTTIEIVLTEQYIKRCQDAYRKSCLEYNLDNLKGTELKLQTALKELKNDIN